MRITLILILLYFSIGVGYGMEASSHYRKDALTYTIAFMAGVLIWPISLICKIGRWLYRL